MFRQSVTSTLFSGKIGDFMFPNINAANHGEDITMVSTLRALLASRLPDGETACVIRADAENLHLESCAQNTTLVLDFAGPSTHQALMEFGMAKNDQLTAYMRDKGSLPASFWISKERKVSAIACDETVSLQQWHFLQSLIPQCFPWLFHKLEGSKWVVDDSEKELIHSLADRGSGAYTDAIAALYNRHDFREAIIRDKLEGFEKVQYRASLESVRRNINDTDQEIESLRRRFSACYEDLERLRIQENGLLAAIQSGTGENEVMDYFLHNPYIHLEKVEGSSVTFTVATVVNNFDPEVFEETIRNADAFWYRSEEGLPYTGDVSDAQIELLARALFEKETLKLKIAASYTLNFASGNFGGNANHLPPEFNDYMPNMHINRYRCMGSGNEQQMMDAMARHDHIAALDICVASAGNMSMEEFPTGELHMKYLLSGNCGNVIIQPDGREVTAKEAIAWLEENEGGGAA